MAMLHHHKRNSNTTGRSINDATLHSSSFYWAPEQQPIIIILIIGGGGHDALRCRGVGYRCSNLTLVRPDESCGGRDLEAAVTRARGVARLPDQ